MTKQALNKMTYGQLNKDFEKTSKNTLVISGYFTSDNKDEVGDIITRGATERAVPAYKQWGNIRFMHQPKPVAKATKIGAEDGLAWNEVEIEVIDPEAVFMVENGLLTALSVGILVDWDDLDFMQDGGLIINDYQLAEISLVDHPANYDAKLKDLVLDHDSRVFAMQYGMSALAEQLGGTTMPRKKEIKEETTEQIVPETVEVEETKIEESVSESELSTESEVVTQEEVVLEQDLTTTSTTDAQSDVTTTEVSLKDLDLSNLVEEEATEEVVEAETEVEEEEEEEVVAEETAVEAESISAEQLFALVNEIKESVASLAKKLEESASKGSVEEQEASEPTEHEKELETLKARNAELESKLAEYEDSTPADRKGQVEETHIEDITDKKEQNSTTPVRDLKTALGEYLKHKIT